MAAVMLYFVSPFFGQNSYVSNIVSYCPAPGQHINDPATGTPATAGHLVGGKASPVSLGAFGGYIIAGFDHTIENDPGNPYGIDFTILGNAFPGSAEPGIVRVMKDENGNSLPDDTWYEIAGSQHYTGNISRNYQIAYFNTEDKEDGDILWKDNFGDTGYVLHNEFHSQSYYPSSEYFPGISGDSLLFSGTRMYIPVHSDKGILKTTTYLFGYADNHSVNITPSGSGPDNPYTPEILEGTGGDAFDISWAVKADGQPAGLDGIDFIIIQSAVNAGAGPLGEISTDVSAILDVAPDLSLSGENRLISLESIPETIPVNAHLTLSPAYFVNGLPASGEIFLFSSDPDIGQMEDGLELIAKRGGEFTLSASLTPGGKIFAEKRIHVVEPSSLILTKKFGYLGEESRGIVSFSIFDQEGNRINDIIPAASTDNADVAKVTGIHSGEITITGLKPGNSLLTVSVPGSPGLVESVNILVTMNIDPVVVSVSVKRHGINILPRRNYSIQNQDINPWIENNTSGDLVEAKDYVSLADVLAGVFLSNGFTGNGKSFRFRKDGYSDDFLYLWQVVTGWEYFYGWGGNHGSETYRKCWLVAVNDTVYMKGFDLIRVGKGDMISVFQVDDIFSEGENLSLGADRLQVMPGEQVSIRYQLIRFHVSEQGSLVLEHDELPLVSALYANDEYLGTVGKFANGGDDEILLSFEKEGHYNISVEGFPGEVIAIDAGNITVVGQYRDLGTKVYPNPFTDHLTIQSGTNGPVSYRLSEISGRILRNGQFDGPGLFYIETTGVPPGIYILGISTTQKSENRIIIKP